VTPDGKFLYGAERRTSMLIGYKIDADKGTLTQIGRFSTEKTPRGFEIDRRGNFLLSVGMDSAAMTVYTIDRASGELKPIGHYPMGYPAELDRGRRSAVAPSCHFGVNRTHTPDNVFVGRIGGV